ncbi:MAG: hypothetical protein OYH77_04925, partial [Pseudomonadota bacterium]|nr:hypothetical protein [Pseudomonadota bacterium]
MKAIAGVLLSTFVWSGPLQAGKYSLITSVARNGVGMRVKIESPAMDNIAPNLANYYKEILIDQLARFKNPLEAHIDLTRHHLSSMSLNYAEIK